MEINQVYKENCISGMQQMDAESVDLCVTSPPYDDLRTYNDSSKWDFEVFKQVAQELYRVVKVGGVVVWVVGDAVIKGGESMSSFRQALYFGELGFLLHDTMIYEKNGSSFPARKDSNRYSQIFEYMFVFSKKTKPKTANLIADKPNKWAGHTNWGKGTYRDKDGNLVERTQKPTPAYSPRNNIWRYNNGKGFTTRDNYAFEHPAMYPEALATDHILTWSEKGDLVLDPFMGAGTTAAMAMESDRNFIGFEIDDKYHQIAMRRVEQRMARLPI
jgi:site-specific DNA-methyltransferase (adenine-specific)